MKTLYKRPLTLVITFSMILASLLLVSFFVNNDEIEVEAAISKKDAGGYMCVDNNSPEPTIDFKWIDAAGNPSVPGFAVTKIDAEIVSFSEFSPGHQIWVNIHTPISSLLISDGDGSGVSAKDVQYSVSTTTIEEYSAWANIKLPRDAPTVRASVKTTFINGKTNWIRFRAMDVAGNGWTYSQDFNVRINSAPTVIAMISEPLNGRDFTTDEKILFDASETVDPDGDDIDFAWYSDINGFLSNSQSFFRALSAGVHTITMIVNDPAHSTVINFDITVLEQAQIDPESIDTDGDGMYDEWEIKYKLNPFRPDGFIDTDHDMFTNFQEYQNKTDPTLRSSHPPYGDGDLVEVQAEDTDVEEQYMTITLTFILLSLIVIIALILLAFSKRKDIKMEIEDEKELEAEESDYRNNLERKKAERLGMEK